MTNNSDWIFHFKLYEKKPVAKLVGSNKIRFHLEKENGKDFVIGFEIHLEQLVHLDAYYKAMGIAKRLTDLMSLDHGDFIGTYLERFEVSTDIGTTSARVMGGEPLKPVRDLNLDLTDSNLSNLVQSSSDTTIPLAHIANALHSSYKTPGSAIRDLVLAFNENLPKGLEHLDVLRDGLSHDTLRIKTISIIQQSLPFKLTFTKGNKIDLTSQQTCDILVMENFHFLHNAIDYFRKKHGILTSQF